MAKYVTILCTVPDADSAERISELLVKEELVACVNIVPGIVSIYKWNGEINRGEEKLLIMKSRAKLFNMIRDSIVSIHPYKVPEIISLPISEGHKPYLSWIDETTKTSRI